MNFKLRPLGWVLAMLLGLLPVAARAQQTLGSINGTVTDSSGAAVQKATVKIRNVGTNLEVTATTKDDGSFHIADLPIGTYSVTFSKDGFRTEVHSEILIQANRTTTVNASLQPGPVSTTVTVTATPLLNQTDTTNGYVLSSKLIESTPLGTGSFTQLAILAPGVNADLLSGSGTNAGFGNQSIWANGQRDTSNGVSFNGINATNVFNGKTTSSVSANRFVLSTGESFSGFFSGGEDVQTSTSVYDAIGQGLPTPPQEAIEELRVNTSMYDASQGANSGAHIELITKSGTNNYHGQVYEYHQTDAWNAAPFFHNADPGLRAVGISPVPKLHRNTFGGNIGGPIIRDKLFFFASYQGLRASDQTNSFAFIPLPPHLTNDRSAATLANVANLDFGGTPCGGGTRACTATDIDPVALALMNAPAPNGGFFIPTPNDFSTFAMNTGFDTVLQGPAARFRADQVIGNIDYNFSAKDRLAAKYYFQRDPTTSPFAISQVLGFTQNLKAGSQVISIDNTTTLTPNLTWEQKAGYIRETAFATTAQPFGPSGFGASINLFGSNRFPGITIFNSTASCSSNPLLCFHSSTIGPLSPFANAGVFQNQFEWASNLNWVHGRHTMAAGFNWDYNQLNVINQNTQVAALNFFDFPSFLTGQLSFGPERTTFLNGEANRYYRSNQVGAYYQDNIKLTRTLTVNAGLRFDWDGPLHEKNGLLTNFYPQNYHLDLASDRITNIGLVVAGNNKRLGTSGVSDSTLLGRQWGFGPRLGFAWSPTFVKNFVVRAGFGLYYDRGQFFTELSPSAGFGFNGPFGVTVEPPFVVPCLPRAQANPVANCGTGANAPTFQNPFGTGPPPAPPSNLSTVAALLPNLAGLSGCTEPVTPGCTPVNGPAFPFLFGGYDPKNKLPYSENWTLDFQWQPRNDLVLTLAYVGNHGLHETIPIPFNQPRIATLTNSVNGQNASYGFQATDSSGFPLVTEQVQTTTGGNTDLRAPFIGYSPNSVFYEAEGVSHYNALQFSVIKRLSQGLQINGSYTWSHTLDEQSGLGLFYNGNNPLDPASAYASSDFDRTHVFTISYLYQFPKASRATGILDKVVNGWGISGVTVLESGQPYSVIDFTGAFGGIFYSSNDFITNPIAQLLPGFTASSAQLQGTTGVNAGRPVLNVNAFGVQTLAPLQDGVPACGLTTNPTPTTICDNLETPFSTTGRNIFRGPFQSRFDFGVFKEFKISERFSLKYDAQFFNLFNHASFDTPDNNWEFDPCFNPSPCFLGPPPAGNGSPPAGFTPGARPGFIEHTLGSPRFIQMALHLTF